MSNEIRNKDYSQHYSMQNMDEYFEAADMIQLSDSSKDAEYQNLTQIFDTGYTSYGNWTGVRRVTFTPPGASPLNQESKTIDKLAREVIAFVNDVIENAKLDHTSNIINENDQKRRITTELTQAQTLISKFTDLEVNSHHARPTSFWSWFMSLFFEDNRADRMNVLLDLDKQIKDNLDNQIKSKIEQKETL